MNAHSALLGLYEPGDGWLFRMPIGWKYLLVLVLTLPPLFLGAWWVSLPMVVVTLAVLWSSGVGPAKALRIGLPLWIMLAAILAYHVATLNPQAAAIHPANMLNAVLAARILTLTTSTPALMDALATGLTPLRWVRIPPRQVALAVALMIRSIPYLIGSVADARCHPRPRPGPEPGPPAHTGGARRSRLRSTHRGSAPRPWPPGRRLSFDTRLAP